MAISHASAKWSGTLKEGAGSMKGGSGFLEAPFTFLTRFEGAKTGTNPEELIGAANAGCFSMFLAAQLTAAGHPPTSIETRATDLGRRPRHHEDRTRDQRGRAGRFEGSLRRKGRLLEAKLPDQQSLGRRSRDHDQGHTGLIAGGMLRAVTRGACSPMRQSINRASSCGSSKLPSVRQGKSITAGIASSGIAP